MKKICLTLLTIALLTAAACVPSVHGIYCEKTQIFDDGLLGYWTNENGDESWRFTRHEGDAYQVLFIEENGKSSVYIGRLVDLEGQRYLDLLPDKRSRPESGFYMPMHIFLKIKELGPCLRMAAMNPDVLKRILKDTPDLVGHDWLEKDDLVLTAQTPELQSFLKNEGGREGLFSDMDPLTKWIPTR